ncbi:helix-turn-helix domain-containing protein [Pseudogracilibacillus auburnensis]|uniref:Transcriptional regulator with XRE-family HTH domain n=1 Tax=Pseudogracilibacillus auburnensis TaxID=1494959 RepID=A0A2V3VXP1_9BACI|nr:helix-turn-helix transcriptional regulator [Pseudogracilibacillus auburnensis]PXW86702.1 transcriptional regulator with XRE-family HTH domain [Pseudogracilibacillus auburnensis]
MSEFGSYIKQIRESKRMTLNQVALYSEISSAQLSRIENGKRGVPKADTIRKIANALRHDYKDLMRVAGYIDGVDVSKKESFDPLTEIQKLANNLGIEDLSFFDIEEWKNLSKEDFEDIKNHFEYIAYRAKQRKKGK